MLRTKFLKFPGLALIQMILFAGVFSATNGFPKDTIALGTKPLPGTSPGTTAADYSGHAIRSLRINYNGEKWVDSILRTMTVDEKIGQLFMVPALSRANEANFQQLLLTVRQYHVGGIIFLRGGPQRQVNLTSRLQAASKIPLLISMDAETGPGMRLDSMLSFPKEMALGAIRDNTLIYKMGLEIARQCRALGVQMNMAPVIDVNDNPSNPIINERSFGEDKMNVALKGIAYMQGLQDGGVLAVAKHFPGHGDSFEDSHVTLPVIERSASEMDSLELYPFKRLINQGISGVMTAHLRVPAFEPTQNLASSLSKPIVTGLLKSKLGFSGLAITDAMNMKGVARFFSPGERDMLALLAGNDIILFSEDLPSAYSTILRAVEQGQITSHEIDSKVRKILTAKYLTGLGQHHRLGGIENLHSAALTNGLVKDLNRSQSFFLRQQLVEASLTVLGNRNKIIPIKDFAAPNLKISEISIGELNGNTFQQTLNRYAVVPGYSSWKDATEEEYTKIADSLKGSTTIIVALHNLEKSEKENYGIRGTTREFIDKLQAHARVILVVFGNPYLLANFADLKNAIVAYDDSPDAQKLVAELIFGAIGANGRLPVTASPQFKAGDGVVIEALGRIKYTVPEDVGLSYDPLLRIDSIARDAIARRAFPGCAIMALKDGKVFYQKAFGTHTYEDRSPVLLSDVFDLASVTKISSTVLASMKLYEQGMLDIRKPVSFYLPELAGSNKQTMTSIDLLTHQAGLVPYIPFYKAAMHNPGVFSRDSSLTYSIRVAADMYLRNDYFARIIWPEILYSPIKTTGKYVYSDLSMYFMRAVVERIAHKRLDTFVTENFYRPMGLLSMGFNPLDRMPRSRMMPTENDKEWRKQLLAGYVHDQGAAMQGGVAGHAGLFSDVNDLAILGQMLLQGGQYAGRQFFRSSTVNYFNTRPFPLTSRRGLGFDKPEKDPKSYPGVEYISDSTFGHTGFTGTCIWVDPKYKLVYVFLSNRLCPNGDDSLLSAMRIRPKIQKVLYEVILSQ